MSKQRKVKNNIRYPKHRAKRNKRLSIFHSWMRMTKKYKKKKAILYLVELYDSEEKFLKVGITTTSVSKRFKGIDYKLRKLKAITSDVVTVFKLESKVLRTFRKSSYKPKKRFVGYTECFDVSKKLEILSYIKRIK